MYHETVFLVFWGIEILPDSTSRDSGRLGQAFAKCTDLLRILKEVCEFLMESLRPLDS